MRASIGDITKTFTYQELFVEGKIAWIVERQVRILDELLAHDLTDTDHNEKTALKQQPCELTDK